ACRFRRPPTRWASPGPRPTATGPTPRPGSTAPSPGKSRTVAEIHSVAVRRAALFSRTVLRTVLPGRPCIMEPKSIDQIFWDAAQLASTAERDAYLDRACAGDVVLRHRVEQLLQAGARAGSFLESLAPKSVATVQEVVGERPGTVIGAYKLLEQIGEGGF